MNTNLQGRLRNTPLPRSHGLLPLLEAVVNSIHSVAERSADPGFGEITVEIIRNPQTVLPLDSKAKRGPPSLEPIIGFKIIDNGVGFHDRNMASFETLDSNYKAQQGCRGVGRLLWLKAFDRTHVSSDFLDDSGIWKCRSFSFTAAEGVCGERLLDATSQEQRQTCVHLDGFNKHYREKSAKNARTIANSLFEHCLWYFVRDGGAPKILIKDEPDLIDLADVYKEYMLSSAKKETIEIKGEVFELTHIKFNANSAKQHCIAWCAASRVVEEESIAGKVAGLHGKIRDGTCDFIYSCYVTSQFLDRHVRPERIGFDIEEMSNDLFSEVELNLTEIRNAVIASSSRHLEGYLKESQKAGRERVENFVAHHAPRYRPILGRIPEDKLSVDPDISDKDLELLLHRQLSEIEGNMLLEGHEVMKFGKDESTKQYKDRLAEYLRTAEDIKKSDLANYVFHRKVILDIMALAIQRGTDGKYVKEELIHELIMPLRKTSNDVLFDSCNLWLVDERLAFHDFLASDRSLSSMPITGSMQTKEPDIVALNVFDEPILVSADERMPLASIVVVEIKRPMRDDAAGGEDRDPIEQALGYLERIRQGRATTASGRPIPRSDEIPGFCYVICDITASVARRCKLFGLTVTNEHDGYFGYNQNYKAYIEVISFDRLLNAARQRNRAFFDKLGLPTT